MFCMSYLQVDNDPYQQSNLQSKVSKSRSSISSEMKYEALDLCKKHGGMRTACLPAVRCRWRRLLR